VAHEDITVHEVSLSDIDSWLAAKAKAGVLIDPKIYAGLYFISRNKWRNRYSRSSTMNHDIADTDAIRTLARAKRMKVVIPAKCNRKHRYRHDKERYGQRNRIERCFGKLKLHRRIATRFDRNDSHFLGFLYLACSILWLN
jgi:transposase